MQGGGRPFELDPAAALFFNVAPLPVPGGPLRMGEIKDRQGFGENSPAWRVTFPPAMATNWVRSKDCSR
jgi:hypothetical protein